MSALPYPNPSLSEMVFEARQRDSLGESLRAELHEGAASSRPHKLRKTLLTAIILMGLVFSCLDTSIVSTALLNISVGLGNDYLNAPWVMLAYLLTYMGFAVGMSKLSDIYGRRNLLIISWLFFSGFSLFCGLAQTMAQLIAGRALQGVGGAGLYSLAQVSLVEHGPGDPAIVGALVGLSLSISYVLGPLLGGVISDMWVWRGVFWINIPAGAISIAGLLFVFPDERRHHWSTWKAITKIDFLGNLLLISASMLLVFSIQEAGSRIWAWNHPIIVWTLTISALSWVLFIVWESVIHYKRTPIDPIFPLRLALHRVYFAALTSTFLVGFGYIALVMAVPERLQILYGDTALWAGVHLLPMLGGCALGSVVAGAVSKKRNLTAHTLSAGASLQVLGTGLLYAFASNSEADLRRLYGFTCIYGFGVGLCFAASTMTVAVVARNHDLAAAQGALSQARVLGGALGIGACTIIFNGRVQDNLALALSAADLDKIHRSPLEMLALPPVLQPLVRQVYIAAFRDQMLVLMAVSAIALIVTFGTFQKDPPLVVDGMRMHKNKDIGTSTRASDTDVDEEMYSVRSLPRQL